MAPLTKILEQARVLQLRTSVGKREAIALAMANERRTERNAGPVAGSDAAKPMQLPLPAASCLDALLPRNREPTMDEIREAWKDCMEQSSVYLGEGR